MGDTKMMVLFSGDNVWQHDGVLGVYITVVEF